MVELSFVLSVNRVLEDQESAAYEWAYEGKSAGAGSPRHRVLHRLPAGVLFDPLVTLLVKAICLPTVMKDEQKVDLVTQSSMTVNTRIASPHAPQASAISHSILKRSLQCSIWKVWLVSSKWGDKSGRGRFYPRNDQLLSEVLIIV